MDTRTAEILWSINADFIKSAKGKINYPETDIRKSKQFLNDNSIIRIGTFQMNT